MRDRHALSFSEQYRSADIAVAFARSGVVMLKGALAPETLATCAEAFRRFVHSSKDKVGVARTGGRLQTDDGETRASSWHNPWSVRYQGRFPPPSSYRRFLDPGHGTSSKRSAARRISPSCSSSAPRGTASTRRLASGRIETQKSWILIFPYRSGFRLVSRAPSEVGLGFVVPAPGRLLPTLPHNDVGAEYVLEDPARLSGFRLTPPGTYTIHSRFAPHFTTGYGTLSDRFSLEIRAMPRSTLPPMHEDPVICVSRRSGIPRQSWKREVRPAAPLKGFLTVRNSAALLPRTCAGSVSESGDRAGPAVSVA